MSGGGGRFIPTSSKNLSDKIEKMRKEAQEKLVGDVDIFLQSILVVFNDRDTNLTNDRLGELSEILGEDNKIDSLLFGGSVAKHTYVDGLSDIDALVVLDREESKGLSSQEVLNDFCNDLKIKLPRKDVVSINAGDLAITIQYSDSTEIQLLPAIRSGDTLKIPSSDGKGWNETNPQKFQKSLTKYNAKLDGALVPTIKLVKSLISDLPKQQQISGYHLEALAIDAAKSYKGDSKPKELISHILNHASERVKTPLPDITGQSTNTDDYLGKANSSQRKLASQALSGINRRLNSATSIRQWKAMFEID